MKKKRAVTNRLDLDLDRTVGKAFRDYISTRDLDHDDLFPNEFAAWLRDRYGIAVRFNTEMFVSTIEIRDPKLYMLFCLKYSEIK